MADVNRALDLESHDGDGHDIDRAWAEVMQRCADLLPFFVETRLDLSATRVAIQMGVRRAQGLERMLRTRRLPPFRSLRNWIYIVQLVQRHESGESVAHWAMQQGEYPTPYYRMVTKESGLLWSDVVGRGSAWCKAEGLRRWRPYLVPSAS